LVRLQQSLESRNRNYQDQIGPNVRREKHPNKVYTLVDGVKLLPLIHGYGFRHVDPINE
jgi:sRNA-binding regulator protein Hfq